MAKKNALQHAETELRQFALSYPEAAEEFPWGHRAIKVKGKIFLALNQEDGVLSLSVKLPLSGRIALTQAYTSPTEYGLGKSGWVSARFAAGDEVPLDLIEQWIDESYRAIAPKKLSARLDAAEAPAAPRTKKRSQQV